MKISSILQCGLIISIFIPKFVSSAVIQPIVVTGADSQKPLLKDENENSTAVIDEMTNFFQKYTMLEVPLRTAESSIDGHSSSESQEHITRTPAYMERVIELQRDFGLEPTGILDAALVKKTITTDRCGMTDEPTDPNAPAAYRLVSKWTTKYHVATDQHHLTYSFQTKTFPHKISSKDIRKGVLSAMCMWELNSNVRFVKNMGNDQNADITIGFGKGDHGDRYSFDGAGGTLAHAFYPESGMLHFDEEEPWFLAPSNNEVYHKRDIFTVAAHELGHNLGLDHSSKTALMAPFYNFQGTFKNYNLPPDDKQGLESMYGTHKRSNPTLETMGNACTELKKKFHVVHAGGSTGGSSRTTTTPTARTTRSTTTRRPVRTSATRRTTTPLDTTCRDDPHLEQYCQHWKDSGYCISKSQEETMMRRCRKTCGLCKATEADVCTTDKFDEFTPTYDGTGRLQFYVYKDLYYFYGDAKYSRTKTLLESRANPRFFSDPKTTKAGQRQIARRFPKTHASPTAVVRTRQWYLVFDADGNVDQYISGGPSIAHVNKYTTSSLFKRYPHKTVDSAHREYVISKEIITLFKGNKMYQYLVNPFSSMFDFKKGENFELTYEPIEGRFGLDISEWKGVSACDVDSVFTYRNVPYFLKGNIFWPADSKEKSVGRDIRYHFFRCSGSRDASHRIPTECNSAFSLHFSFIQSLAFFVLSMLFART